MTFAIYSSSRLAAAIVLSVALKGCITAQVFPLSAYEEQPYALLTVDQSMSCDALTASFMFAARRAARLIYWLDVGPPAGYGNARYELDAPDKLRDEFRRMDALSDQQRYKGCVVLEPRAIVAEELRRLDPTLPPPLLKGPVLRRRG